MLPDVRLEADILVANYGTEVIAGTFPQLLHGRKASSSELMWFLGSERWAASDQFKWVDDRAHAARIADQVAWATVLQEHRDIEKRRGRSKNIYIREPYDEGGAPPELSITRRRMIVAKVRLCRLLIRALLNEESPVLPDPFGTVLHSANEKGGTKFWSVGLDGVDGGGVGEWDTARIERTGDIVLRLRHR
jgi:hypothetical protein